MPEGGASEQPCLRGEHACIHRGIRACTMNGEGVCVCMGQRARMRMGHGAVCTHAYGVSLHACIMWRAEWRSRAKARGIEYRLWRVESQGQGGMPK